MRTCFLGLWAWCLTAVRLASTQSADTSLLASVTEPCARVSSLWVAQKSTSPHATPTVAAGLAHDCLRSIPLGRDAAIELVDAMVPYLEWQSDSSYKADPPADYPFPGYDIFANLAKIREDLVADKYESEYDFQLDLYLDVVAKGHDGHFLFYPDAMARVFSFERPQPLVSISEDGIDLPVIKFYEDVISNPDTASVLTHINGVPAAVYVDDFGSSAVGYQDKDAIYNSMFFSLSSHAAHRRTGFFARGGRTRFLYPGSNTTFTFANGSEITLENKASITADMTGVIDGKSYYTKFCNPNGMAAANANATQAMAADAVKTSRGSLMISGYPTPVAITSDKTASCYYLQGEGYDDVVVISLLDMIADSIPEFQAVIQKCIAEAISAGKNKLVVDLLANGGGYVLLGYDFFRQLFPNIIGDALSRWKETDGFLAAAEVVSEQVADFNPYISSDSGLIRDWETWFNYRSDYNISRQPFLSFEDKFGPHVYQNTTYTNILRWNFDGNLSTTNDTFGVGIEITGYGSLANTSQPFLADNIILLYDGACASTCSIMSEMLRTQGGVKSIAMGGRPIEGPIQGIGGIKGAQSLRWSDIHAYMTRYMPHAKDDQQAATFARYSTLPLNRSVAAMVNVRDAIPQNHIDDGLPAQYVVQPADCRLYWTAPMITDATAIWKAATNAAFNGAPCMAGSVSAPVVSNDEHLKKETHHALGLGASPKAFSSRVSGERYTKMSRRSSLQHDEWLDAQLLNSDVH